jgi:drug/metabolite transporter (DMT)-like permease
VPWAKLDWDDPRKMTSGWGSIASFAVWLGMGLLGGLFLALPVFFEALDPLLTPALALLGLLCATAVSAGVAYLTYKYGERKLPEVG